MNHKLIIACLFCFILTEGEIYSKDYSSIIDSLKKVNSKINIETGIKGKTLYNLSWYYYASQSFDSSICYSKLALQYAFDKNLDTIAEKSAVILGAVFTMKTECDSAIYYLRKGASYFEKNNKIKYEGGLAKIYSLLANAYSEKMKYNEAYIYYDKSESLYIKTSDTSGLIFNKIAKGNLFESLQLYDKALIEYNNAIGLSISSGKISNLRSAYNDISAVYKKTGDKGNAKKYLFKAIDIMMQNNESDFSGDSYHNLSLLYSDQNRYDSAFYFNGLAISIFKKQHLLFREMSARITKCDFYFNIGQLKSMQICFDSIVEVPDELKAKYFLLQSKLLYKKNNVEKAINYAGQALLFAQKNKDIEFQKNAYELLYEENIKKHDFQKALIAHENYMMFKDSMFNKEKSIAVQKVIVEKVIEEKDAELKLKTIEHEKELTKKNILIWIALSVVICLLSLVIVIYLMFKNKKQKAKNAELEIELNKEIFQNEIQLKEKELELNKNTLLVYTQHLVEKNKLLEELNGKLKELQTQHPEDQGKIEKITMLTSSKIITEDNWEQFKHLFGKVHEGFFFKLKRDYPGITTAESRLAALIKLNISSKEIASMIGISDDSVKKTRQRLRKKMQLDTVDGLEETIFKM